ncbi:cell pole-organizing protein PopZ [Bosea sp. OAE506]|jgi:cell pole-organizing protein PopZ|uniref:PopZ family protein n=1 Tax=Bosea sp. OAE506 TaxID=2663870 RepID=UPI00178A0ED2
MSAQPKANEPSMEEILASIRRIISDDEVKPAEAGVEPAPIAEEPPPSTIDDDVLDLGAEAALIPAPEPEPAPPADGDVDFLEPVPEPEPVAVAPPPPPPPEPAPAPVFAAAPAPPAFDMAQLLSDQTSSAVTSAFGQLAHTVLTNNARTLEDLVKDMLKPMLKSWLDDNLPTMVERLVRAEIERVARGGRH